jgi:23S rRNA pseudouridine1911/1915/1917 synthase
MSSLRVLYEDNHLIAVFKPAGVLSQGDKTGDKSILDDAKQYLKEKYHKPGNVFLGLLHRLDRPVAGIVLFAKTSKGAARLSEQFRQHTVKKTYQALVLGKLHKEKGTLINKLGKDEKLNKAKEYANGEEARLHYEVIKSNEKYSLLQVTIETGKFHQIRAQLSLAGHPILGDVKYKAPSPLPDKSVALCATGLSFYPATSDELVTISIPTPKEWEEYLK